MDFSQGCRHLLALWHQPMSMVAAGQEGPWPHDATRSSHRFFPCTRVPALLLGQSCLDCFCSSGLADVAQMAPGDSGNTICRQWRMTCPLPLACLSNRPGQVTTSGAWEKPVFPTASDENLFLGRMEGALLSSRLRKTWRRTGRFVCVGWRQVLGIGGKEKVRRVRTKLDRSRSLGLRRRGRPIQQSWTGRAKTPGWEENPEE